MEEEIEIVIKEYALWQLREDIDYFHNSRFTIISSDSSLCSE